MTGFFLHEFDQWYGENLRNDNVQNLFGDIPD